MDEEETFMRLYRNGIILVAVLAVLIGVFFLTNKMKSKEEDSSSIKIVSLDREQLSEIDVKNSEGNFVFSKKGTEWEMTSTEKFDFDKTKVDSIAANMADLLSSKIVEENPDDIEKYGLKDPVVVTVKTTDGKTEAVEVGDETPTKQGYYLKKKDNNTVYIVGQYVGEALRSTKTDLRNKSIFDANSEDVVFFSLEKNGENVFDLEKKDDQWKMVKPVNATAHIVKLNPIIESIIRMQVEEYVEKDPSDLSKYGLQNPKYAFRAKTANMDVKVLLGNAKEDMMYGMIDGTNEVIKVYSSSLDFVDMPAIQMTDQLVYIADINNVSEVLVKIDGKTINSKIEANKDDKDKEKFYIDGKDVTAKGEEAVSKFRAFYRSLVGVAFNDILTKENPQGEPVISITYKLKSSPGQGIVEFIQKDENTYYAMVDGKYTGTVVNKDAFYGKDGIIQSYDALTDFIK